MNDSTNTIEVELVILAIRKRYGLDFSGYSQASLIRRMQHVQSKWHLENISEILPIILHSEEHYRDFVSEICVTVTEMFRDAFFYRAFRKVIVPELAHTGKKNIWIAGCCTGEEAYSLAIILFEEGILNSTMIFATDIDEKALQTAKAGRYSLKSIRSYTESYLSSGGKECFSDYYTLENGSAVMTDEIKSNIVFSTHNLIHDQSFQEMEFISCRNVLIYFDLEFQQRAIKLFDQSLVPCGYLALGSKESLCNSNNAMEYKTIDSNAKIYQKMGSTCLSK